METEKEKLIGIINDIMGDNDFNEDVVAKKNINISLKKLIKELGISEQDMGMYIDCH